MKSRILIPTIVVCQLALSLYAQEVPADEAAAQQAVSARNYAAGLALYTRLTEQYPDRAEYWIWAGRLSGYLGKYSSALQCYDHALGLAPDDVDAITGKAYVLMYEHQYSEASALLEKASALAPGSSEVNMAIAREKFYQGHSSDAEKYTKLILAKDPNNKEALELRSRLRQPWQVRLELGVGADRLPFSLGMFGLVDVGLTSPDTFASVRYEDWSRFGEGVNRGGFTYSHTFHHLWTIDTTNLIGSRGDVLPRYDDSLTIARRLKSGWAASVNYRALLFDQVHANLLGPGVEYYFESPIWLQANYFHSWTDYRTGSVFVDHPTNAASLRYNQRIARATLHVGYARGTELFAIPLVDEIGQFRENSYSTAVDIPVSRTLTPKFEYDLLQRSSGVLEQIFAARLVFQK